MWTVVVAGGSGLRFGGPKQFLPLRGRPLVAWAVDAVRAGSDGVVLVVPSDLPPDTPGPASDLAVDTVVPGGPTRTASVRAGLAAVPDDAGIIVVHDAARPLAPASLFDAVVAVVEHGAEGSAEGRAEGRSGPSAVGSGPVVGAVPVLPVVDTLKRVVAGEVVETVDRSRLVVVQTPQAFVAAALRSAHRSGREATDDAGLIEEAGGRVVTVAGDPRNVKVTRPEDLALADAFLGTVGAVSDVGRPMLRVGQGIDVHRFSNRIDRPLVLGGVVVTGEGARGLEGHSDADVVAHAVADAVLGAAGLGDLGRHAPDTDPQLEGADSLDILARMVDLAARDGWIPVNGDCTVVAERPRLAPYVERMAEQLAEVLGAPVNVKATRAEGLGALGRAEGIACTAVVLMVGIVGGTGTGPGPEAGPETDVVSRGAG